MPLPYDLTGKLTEEKYPRLVQIGDDNLLYNGLGVALSISGIDHVLFSATGKRNTTNVYLSSNAGFTNVMPFVIPKAGKISYISAKTTGAFTWTAEVHVNGVLLPGAILNLVAVDKAYVDLTSFSYTVAPGDEISLYCNGAGIVNPVVNAFLQF